MSSIPHFMHAGMTSAVRDVLNDMLKHGLYMQEIWSNKLLRYADKIDDVVMQQCLNTIKKVSIEADRRKEFILFDDGLQESHEPFYERSLARYGVVTARYLNSYFSVHASENLEGN